MRKPIIALTGCVAALLGLAACSSADPAPVKTVVVVQTQPPADDSSGADASSAKVESADEAPVKDDNAHKAKTKQGKAGDAEETFTMPKVTGMVLQDAQDELQSLDSYLMDQEDAMGWGRMQLLDSNWKVCTQKPAAGKKVSVSTVVKLASVKLCEDCP
jgi:beta-lactam-binding protein with PASTA domain